MATTRRSSAPKPAKKKGLSPKTFRGLNKKRIEKSGGQGGGRRVILKAGNTVPIQFLEKPEDMTEFEVHVFQEDGRWEFVPCAGDGCPLCDDENERKSKTSYRFCTNVYNLKDRKVQILEGPKDLAGRVFYRYERAPRKFMGRSYDVTRFEGSPVSYDVSVGEDDPVQIRGLKLHNLDEYILDEMKRYYGDDLDFEANSLAADDDDEDLDDLEEEDEDEDLEDEEDEDLEDDDEDLDDEDDDEDDEDEDEDEDEEDEEDEDDDDFDLDDLDDDEDEEPEPPKRATRASKAPAKAAAATKKAPAKAAAAKKTTTRRK
jgi:hypothetical protein